MLEVAGYLKDACGLLQTKNIGYEDGNLTYLHLLDKLVKQGVAKCHPSDK